MMGRYTGRPCTVKQFAVDNNDALVIGLLFESTIKQTSKQWIYNLLFPNLVQKSNKKRQVRREDITSEGKESQVIL